MSRLAYPCIGGPLDGEYATSEDFHGYRPINPETKKPYRYGETPPDGRYSWQRDEGMYAHLKHEYVEYNGSGGGSKRVGGFPPTMVYIHKSVLKPLQSPRKR